MNVFSCLFHVLYMCNMWLCLCPEIRHLPHLAQTVLIWPRQFSFGPCFFNLAHTLARTKNEPEGTLKMGLTKQACYNALADLRLWNMHVILLVSDCRYGVSPVNYPDPDGFWYFFLLLPQIIKFNIVFPSNKAVVKSFLFTKTVGNNLLEVSIDAQLVF